MLKPVDRLSRLFQLVLQMPPAGVLGQEEIIECG